MATYFIADLHLSEQCPNLIEAFRKFISHLQDGDELYILGDLFNFFVGLDKQDKAQKIVASTLASAKQRGISTYFIHGNRDFLISKKDAETLNMTLLEDRVLLNKAKAQILATHGDAFCTNDLAYQKYAKTVSNPIYQCIFRCLPLPLRRKIGQRIRNQSQESNYQRRDPKIYGVVPTSVATAFEQLNKTAPSHCSPQSSVQAKAIESASNKSNTDKATEIEKVVPQQTQPRPLRIVVHGHIHDFSEHHNESDAYDIRYVLGSWGKYYSYLKYDPSSGFSFVEVPIN